MPDQPDTPPSPLTDKMPGPFFRKGLDGRYADCNHAWCELLGLSREEILGKGDAEILPRSCADELIEQDAEFLRTGKAHASEQCLRLPGRPAVWLSVKRVPYHGTEGRLSGMLGLCREITGPYRRRREADRRRERPELLGTLAEEMRTPLNAVLGFAGMLQETRLSDEQHDWLDRIQCGTQGVLDTVGSLLEFAQYSTRRHVLETTHFAPRELIVRTCKEFLPRLLDKGLDLSYRVDPEVPAEMVGDRTRLRQILVSLIDNAVRYTEVGEVVVHLSIHASAKDPRNPRLLLRVKDTGSGLPTNELERIFAPFYQSPHTPASRGQGHGLGLAIARELCEMHDGELWAESEPGKGSTFHAELRLGLPAGVQAPAASEKGILPAPTSPTPAPSAVPPAGQLRVLMAEDTPSAQKLGQILLRKLGHEVTLVCDGQQLLTALRDRPFDLVLLDLHMPGMDGLEAARRIRGGEAGTEARDIYISALTVNTSDETKQACARAGLNGFLPKPLLLGKLMRVVAEAREHRRSGKASS